MRKIQEMNPAVLSQLNDALRKKEPALTGAFAEAIHTERVVLNRRVEANIKLLDSETGPFVSAFLLVDSVRGCRVVYADGNADPNKFNGTYTFEHEGETYEVVLK